MGFLHKKILSIIRRTRPYFNVTAQFFAVTCKNPFRIDFADGIFAFQPMFSYGQRSECTDLPNSYILIHFALLFNDLLHNFDIFFTKDLIQAVQKIRPCEDCPVFGKSAHFPFFF